MSCACPTELKTSRALIVASCEVWPGCLCLLPLDLFVTRAGPCHNTMCDQGPCFQLPSAPGVPCSPEDGHCQIGRLRTIAVQAPGPAALLIGRETAGLWVQQ